MKYFISLLFLFYACGQQPSNKSSADKMYKKMRSNMVQTQIANRGIKDKEVLRAMHSVPRHEFVPDHLKKYAYADEPLPIGEDQTISQPYIVAYMTEKLELSSGDKVLEIGTGSGYQAAVLSELVDSVFTIEIVDVLAKRAGKKMAAMGYKNIYVKSGDGYKGWPEHAPFDAIIITAAPTIIPEPLVEQLKIGGRLILPLGDYSQDLFLITKNQDGITEQRLLPVRFVPMTGEIED